MIFFSHVGLFLLAGLVQTNQIMNRGNLSAIVWLGTLVGGVIFLGWWALLTFFIGVYVGSYAYFTSSFNKRDDE